MAELTTLARPYAKAAFDFANDANKVSDWQEYLVFSAGVVSDTSFERYLQLPNLSQNDKLQALVTVSNNSFSAEFINFVAQLSENDRLTLLPAIASEYEALKAESEKELKADVESAYDLASSEVVLLQKALEKRFGQKVQMVVTTNPELIAGVVIRVGDQVIDDTAIAKLKQLKTKLTA